MWGICSRYSEWMFTLVLCIFLLLISDLVTPDMLGFISSIGIIRWYHWAYTICWSQSGLCGAASWPWPGSRLGSTWAESLPRFHLCLFFSSACSSSLHFFPYCWSYAPWLGTNIPCRSKVSTSLCLRVFPTLPWCFTYCFRACSKLASTLFIDTTSKEKQTGRGGMTRSGRSTGVSEKVELERWWNGTAW